MEHIYIPFSCRWIYSDASITKGTELDGKIAYYGAGGYYFDFPENFDEARAIIDDLILNTWLTRATKAVVINMASYNGNMKLVSVIEYEHIINNY